MKESLNQLHIQDGAHLSWEPPSTSTGDIVEYSVYLAVKSATTSTQVLLPVMVLIDKLTMSITHEDNPDGQLFSGRHQNSILLPIPVGLCQGLLWSICSGYKATLLNLQLKLNFLAIILTCSVWCQTPP